ncbi:MAG: ThuA domain-containing protein [Verrucomicrobiota bacterium]
MKHVVSLVIGLTLLGGWVRAESPLKIHMISGSKEYKSEPSLKAFEKVLTEHYKVAVTASWVRDGAKDLPGIEHIPEADLLLVFARRMKLPEEQMKVIRTHWEDGKPVVGLRTSSHAFQKADNERFDRKVMGGNYTGHYGKEAVAVKATEAGSKHPTLKGVGPFTSGKLYKAGELAEGAVTLQTGSIKGKPEQAVTWVHTYNGGRMFYSSAGVPTDFEDENFRRMLMNAIFWTTRREPESMKR